MPGKTNCQPKGKGLEILVLLCGLIIVQFAGAADAGMKPSVDARFSQMAGREGFWRLAKSPSGVWWFLSPSNKPEFLNMVTTVQPALHGRDPNGAEFCSLEDASTPAALDSWAKTTIHRLTEMGFKGVGAWSNPVLHNYDVPMTQDLNLSAWVPANSSLIYSHDWSSWIEKAIIAQTSALRDNRNLVGYFLDNEMPWDDQSMGPAVYFDGLSANDPNRQEVIGTIRSTWATPQAFNRDWNSHIANWSALDSWRELPRQAEAYQKLAQVWLGHVAETYFKTTCTLLRQHDPNHLILGVRFRGNAPREVVGASRGQTDAQSLNYYVCDAKLDSDLFKMLSEESQQPIIVSEFSFHCLDNRSGDRNMIGFDAQVLDQQARADGYRMFTSRLARLPYVIGADWFQWMDEPPSGRLSDGEDVNFGVVDIDDRPYEKLVRAIHDTAPKLNGLHEASATDKEFDIWRETFAGRASFDVPYLTHAIHINGELSDWPENARLKTMHPGLAVGSNRDKLPVPHVYLGWREQGIYLAFEVFDDDVAAAPAGGSWWSKDCVEFWISTHPVKADQRGYDPDCHHFFFVPVDCESRYGVSGVVGRWHSPGDGLTSSIIPEPKIKSDTRILNDRYVTEIFIPAHVLHGWDPKHQPQLGFNIHVRNYQHAAEYFWSAPKQVLTQARPSTWGSIYLTGPSLKPIQNNLVAGVEVEAKQP